MNLWLGLRKQVACIRRDWKKSVTMRAAIFTAGVAILATFCGCCYTILGAFIEGYLSRAPVSVPSYPTGVSEQLTLPPTTAILTGTITPADTKAFVSPSPELASIAIPTTTIIPSPTATLLPVAKETATPSPELLATRLPTTAPIVLHLPSPTLETWCEPEQRSTGIKRTAFVQRVSGAISDSGTLYAGTSNAGIYWTQRKAKWWDSVGGQLEKGTSILSIEVDPVYSDVAYIGTNDGLYRIQAGVSWEASLALDGKTIYAIALEPGSANTVYVGTNDGLYRSMDAGSSWEHWGLQGKQILSLALDPFDRMVAYAGAMSDLNITTDGGVSWEAVGDPTMGTSFCLAIDPKNKGTIYAGTPNGVWKTTNGGYDWDEMSDGLTYPVYDLAIQPDDTHTIHAATVAGVFVSSDGAASWNLIAPLVAYSIWIHPSSPRTLYVASGVHKVIRFQKCP